MPGLQKFTYPNCPILYKIIFLCDPSSYEFANKNKTIYAFIIMNYCNYCPGYCCYRLKGSVLLIEADDINRLARHFLISDGEVRKRFMENKNTFKVKKDGSCILQSNERMIKRCTVHSARPRQCRNFPYDDTCPYLEREDLLTEIQPRLEKSLRNSWLKK